LCREHTTVRHNVNEKFVNDKYGSEGYTTQGAKFIVSVYHSKLYVLAIRLDRVVSSSKSVQWP